ncbi:hypothetical protein ACFQ3W_14105 [Paenibacillus puldeungensis]|uniref:Uncharacterized protein n=1 Tax=Paenibacillus puldeungensis TaxID=696536 RepID=A0ABW3S084_9BACL
MSRKLIRIVTVFCTILFVGVSGLFVGTPRAEAGYWNDLVNGVKELGELPSDVKELKVNYQVTLDKLDEAQGTLEAYRKQNEELIERNKELAATVSALNEAQQVREANARKTRIMLLTGGALLAGYFIILRVVRLVLRR